MLQPPAGLDQQASTSLAQSAECLPAACANEFDPMSLHNAPRPGVDKSSCVLQSLAGIDQQATPSDLAQPFVEGSGKVRVGVYRTPEAWVTEALQLPHPMDSYNPLQEATLEAIKANLTTEARLLVLKQKIALTKMEILAKQLEQDEAALHRSKPEWMQKILEGKRILLLKHMLEQHQYNDMGVVDLVSEGTHLVGAAPKPDCFEARVRLAKLSAAALRDAAPDLRTALLANPRSSNKDEADALGKVTGEEREAGFLTGPFSSEAEVTAHLGTGQWLAVRRFLLRQGEKLRPIDDGHEAQLNDAFGSSIRLRLQDSNYFAAMAMAVAKLQRELGVCIPWKAKCLDLSKAYKQFCVSDRDRSLSVIVIFDEKGAATWYVANALMFGAAASVFSFNRISRALHFLFTKVLNVVCSYFYDDYPMLARADTAEATDQACGRLLDLLGIRFARTGADSKGKPFENVFDVLGLSVSVDRLHLGKLVLANKPGRIERLIELFSQARKDGTITKHMGQVLVGLLRFAAGSCVGMSLQHVCADLNRMIHAEAFPSSAEFAKLCDRALKFLSESRPREVSVTDSKEVIHVFTDGSLEGNFAGIGAVILDPSTGYQKVLQGQVPDQLMQAWRSEAGDHLICQIELFAVICVKTLIPQRLEGRRVIYWIDNEAARLALVKGQSKSSIMDRMIRELCLLEDRMLSYAWYTRVPSKSNIADAPSRGKGDCVAQASGMLKADIFPGSIPWKHLLRG